MIRKPYVAGQFYPNVSSALKKQLESFIDQKQSKEKALGLISPHADYMFSGSVAGVCFSQTKITQTVILLGPNHTGEGVPFSIMTEGTWQTPLGDVKIDTSLAKKVLEGSAYLEEDDKAHLYEHSIEVQLPFLQFFSSKVKIVPIVLSIANLKSYNEIGKSIACAIKDKGEDVLIIASSDMSHYEVEQKAKTNDNLAIESILELDEKGLLDKVNKHKITMCGCGPVVSMLSAVKDLGAKEAKLLKYQTSGDVSGDYSSVVGYAGIMVK